MWRRWHCWVDSGRYWYVALGCINSNWVTVRKRNSAGLYEQNDTFPENTKLCTGFDHRSVHRLASRTSRMLCTPAPMEMCGNLDYGWCGATQSILSAMYLTMFLLRASPHSVSVYTAAFTNLPKFVSAVSILSSSLYFMHALLPCKDMQMAKIMVVLFFNWMEWKCFASSKHKLRWQEDQLYIFIFSRSSHCENALFCVHFKSHILILSEEGSI